MGTYFALVQTLMSNQLANEDIDFPRASTKKIQQ